MKGPMHGEKAQNVRLLHISPRFVELRQLFSALSEQRAVCWPGNTTTRESLLSRARQFCLVSLPTLSLIQIIFELEIEENFELVPENDEQ